LVDSWHFTFSDDTWEVLAALPLDEIAYVQFDDHPALESDDLIDETLRRRLMPGEGEFELTRFCEVLRAKGYTRPVSCEVLSDATRQMDRFEFAKQVHDSSRPYWS
jgi:sugar phosphate isomerase/epimerase